MMVDFSGENGTDIPGEYLARVVRTTEKEMGRGQRQPLYLVAATFKFIKESRRSTILAYLNRRSLG